MLLAFAITFFILAALLILIGWRGWRIDDHPHCRRCGFALTGTPASTTRCSECGTDLSRRGAVRLGWRRRRHDLVLAGSLFFILAATSVVLMFTNVNTRRYAPTWMLVRETRSATADPAAWGELTRRVQTDELSGETAVALTERVLAWQANAKQPWLIGWGDFVEAAADKQLISEKRWQTYLHNAPQISLEVTPPGILDEDLNVTLALKSHRSGSRNLLLMLGRRAASGDLIQKDWQFFGKTYFNIGGARSARYSFSIPLDLDAFRSAFPGPKALKLQLNVAMVEKRDDDLAAEWKYTIDHTWNLPAASQPSAATTQPGSGPGPGR